jgi:hypothetical protein
MPLVDFRALSIARAKGLALAMVIVILGKVTLQAVPALVMVQSIASVVFPVAQSALTASAGRR